MPDAPDLDVNEANLLKMYAAPDTGAQAIVQGDPNAEALAAKLSLLAAQTLSLWESIETKRKYDTVLRRVYVHVSGLSSVCAMHCSYNQLTGILPSPAPPDQAAVVAAANNLLATLCQHPAYVRTEGTLCEVDARNVDDSLKAFMAQECGAIASLLLSDDLKTLYKTWSLAATTGPLTARDLQNHTIVEAISNRIFADALEALAVADPTNEAVTSAIGLAESSMDDLEADPDTATTVLRLTFPTRARLKLALSANVGGELAPLLGKDSLLLKIAQLYCTKQFNDALASYQKAADVQKLLIGKIAKALQADAAVLEKKFEDYADKAQTAAGFAHIYADRPELGRAYAEMADGARNDFKEFVRGGTSGLGENNVLLDGRLGNFALGIFSAFQFWDSWLTFRSSPDWWKAPKWKALADVSTSVSGATSAAVTFYARVTLANGSSAAFLTNVVGPIAGDVVMPVATIVSGLLQAWGGRQSGNNTDLAAGLLNVASGAFSGAIRDGILQCVLRSSLACLPADAVPLIGPAAAVASVAIGLADAAQELTKSNVAKYVTGAIGAVRSARWDGSDERSVADALGITASLAALDQAAAQAMFFRIPQAPGVSREGLLRSLVFYTMDDDFAASMIDSTPVGVVYGPATP